MEKKYILIIIALIAVIIAIAGLIVANIYKNDIQYETLQLSDTCAVSVPISNNSTFTEDNDLKTYTDTDLKIVSYNKNDLGTWENLGADIGVTKVINENFKYNHTHKGKNILIHPEENKTTYGCLITNNTTGDVIIVMTPNEDLLYHIIDNVNFTTNNTDSKNATENTVKTTNNTAKTTSEKTPAEDEYAEGYIAENDVDIDYDGDGIGDGSAYHSHEYYVEKGQSEPVPLGGG